MKTPPSSSAAKLDDLILREKFENPLGRAGGADRGQCARVRLDKPVLVDGENGIIAGHGRVLAARKAGHGRLPCIELAGLSDTQRRAYIIADNKLALNAGWDDELLAIGFSELSEAGYDLALTGFTQDEIDALVDYDSEPDAIAQDLSQKTRRQLQEMVTYGGWGDTYWCAATARIPARSMQRYVETS